MHGHEVEDLALSVRGRFLRVISVRDEPYDCLEVPGPFIERLKNERTKGDLFTFMQPVTETEPKYNYFQEWESLAALPITTYKHWFDSEIGFKARNKIRKAWKAGVELRTLEFNRESIEGIMGIYNESPLIQGRRNWHYGKDFQTMERMLSTFRERSTFVGAFYRGEMIGFIKVVRSGVSAGLMHILSKTAHRDKAPTNALVAKAVEVCAEQKLSCLHYGIWSRRGLGVFKISHCFTCLRIPKYYVPLTAKGAMMLRLRLHRKFREHFPEEWVDRAVTLRNKWNAFRQSGAFAAEESSRGIR
jgi:Acetyltransferase (GNAT) domain